MRKIQFVNDEYYHIYNRGVEKRDIYLDRNDYERFLYLLFVCNDVQPVLNSQVYYRGLASIENYGRERSPIVDIICFCLMPNHFHLILRQGVDKAISSFMQRLGTGYTMYFNLKRQRVGSLFQGTFKAIHIDTEEYLHHLTRYIHLNPAELQESKWKEKGIKNWEKTYDFIKEYPWSTYSSYLGERRFSALINTETTKDILPSAVMYEQFTKEWLVQDLDFISNYTIEA